MEQVKADRIATRLKTVADSPTPQQVFLEALKLETELAVIETLTELYEAMSRSTDFNSLRKELLRTLKRKLDRVNGVTKFGPTASATTESLTTIQVTSAHSVNS